MSELDDVRARLTALEDQVRVEAAARASVDDDQQVMGRQLSAARHLIQALAITQSEHTDALTRIEAGQLRIIGMLNLLINREPGER